MGYFLKYFGWIFAVLFLISAVLQYNDPDPLLWIFIYTIAAIVSIGFIFDKLSFGLPLVLGILSSIGFLYLLPENFEGFTIGEGNIKNIEEAREAFGLLITAMAMFVYSLGSWLKQKSKI
jgi:hypothetical protein